MGSLNDTVQSILVGISVPTLCFTVLAWWINREKLRLDLYNKRCEVFRAALDLSNVVIGWSGSAPQLTTYRQFLRALIECQFLFPAKSGVPKILREVNQKFSKVFAVNEIRQRGAHTAMPQEFMKSVLESTDSGNWILSTAIPQLTEKMKPYLDFHTLRV